MHPTLARLSTRLHAAGISKATKAKGILAAIKAYGLPADPRKPSRKLRAKWTKVPFADSVLAEKAAKDSESRNPRKKNWLYSRPIVGTDYTTAFEGFRYKGKHSGRIGSNGIPQYPSYVEYATSSGAIAHLSQEGKRITTRWAPKGMRWSHDEHGVFLRDEKGYDYHPTANDFRAKNFAGIVRDAISAKKKAEARLKKQAKEKLEIEATLKNPNRLAKYWVSREDSLSAGNCGAGTDRFIATINRVLGDGIGAIRADVLLGNWRSIAVEKAVRVAIARSI
jgi:hypothetical protein